MTTIDEMLAALPEHGNWKPHWKIEKWETDEDWANGLDPYDVVEFDGNLLLNVGITDLWTALTGGSITAYSNANARLGVGDNNPGTAAAASQTGLQAVVGQTAWAASHAYSLNNIVRPTASTNAATALFYFTCTTAGTSGASEPTWNNTDGGTTSDGSVVWTAHQRATFKAMNSTYPSISTNQITFQSTFNTGDANYGWQEFVADNGSTNGHSLNRLVSNQGTKASGTWQLTLTVTIS